MNATSPIRPLLSGPRLGIVRSIVAGVLALLLAALVPAAPTVEPALAAVPGATDDLPGSVAAPPPPRISAQAVYVFDATVGTELYALEPDERRRPASLTKVATALVVLQHAQLDDLITIEQDDLVDDSQSRVGLEVGDRLTVGDLLKGLLIASGNDAARVLARAVGASLAETHPAADGDPRAAFVAEMNATVERLGLANTHFVNPAGLDEKEHYASARDLALLTAEALNNPTFAEIVRTSDAVLGSERRADGYAIATTNDLLLEGLVEGVKTGTTGEAGGCLISAFTVGSNRVIAVVLGSPLDRDETGATIPESTARFDDMRSILAALPVDYRWLDPAVPGEVAGLTEELAVWQAAIEPGPAVVVPVQRSNELRYRVQLGPPGAARQPVGKVLFFVGADLLSERPVLQTA